MSKKRQDKSVPQDTSGPKRKPASEYVHHEFFMPNAVLFRQAGEELRADEKRQKMIDELISGPIPKYY